MNGNWYSWGAGHVPAATWVAAWQRVVTDIRAVGGTQVTWLWTISHRGSAPIRPYWPGAAYVSWVGIDGYFERPSDSYGSVFGSSVGQVRSFTSKPILLSEVGVGPGTGRQPPPSPRSGRRSAGSTSPGQPRNTAVAGPSDQVSLTLQAPQLRSGEHLPLAGCGSPSGSGFVRPGTVR